MDNNVDWLHAAGQSDAANAGDAHVAAPDNGVPAPSGPGASPGKGGLVAAVIVLVVVLGAAALAYHFLIDTGAAASKSTAASSTGSTQGGPWLSDYDCTVYTDDGVAMELTRIADGKPLVVNFWATWCPYCIDEMGDFQALYNDYGDKVAFAFVDAADGKRETVQDARDWMQQNGYSLPAYYDTTQDAVRTFGITAYPTTVVVAASGEIMAITPGRIDAQLMRRALDSLL